MSWICKKCETENPDSQNICEVCDCPRPTGEEDNLKQLIAQHHIKIETLKSECSRLHNEISSLQHEKTRIEKDKETQIKSLRTQLNNKRSNINDLSQQCYQLRRLIRTLEKTIDEKSRALEQERVVFTNQKEAFTKYHKKSMFFALIFCLTMSGAFLYILFNPNEVEKEQMGDFVYSGEVSQGKPHGLGIAVYPDGDKDDRQIYIGHFVNGERQDSFAVLFYKEGDFYLGSFEKDHLGKGIFFRNSDNSHFYGSFIEDEPYSGKWYEHKKAYEIVKLKKQP